MLLNMIKDFIRSLKRESVRFVYFVIPVISSGQYLRGFPWLNSFIGEDLTSLKCERKMYNVNNTVLCLRKYSITDNLTL